jgi:Transposase
MVIRGMSDKKPPLGLTFSDFRKLILKGFCNACVKRASRLAKQAFILKQGSDGMTVADICRKAGISQATYFNWKKKYDGLLPTEMRRLKPP